MLGWFRKSQRNQGIGLVSLGAGVGLTLIGLAGGGTALMVVAVLALLLGIIASIGVGVAMIVASYSRF